MFTVRYELNFYILRRRILVLKKLVETLERTKIWSWVRTGPETKIYWAGEGQQQFSRMTDMVVSPVGLGTKNHSADEDQQ
jgi:hypothetical protein